MRKINQNVWNFMFLDVNYSKFVTITLKHNQNWTENSKFQLNSFNSTNTPNLNLLRCVNFYPYLFKITLVHLNHFK